MSQQDDKQRAKRERIERLRERVRGEVLRGYVSASTAGILQGLLDLLADEL